MVPDKFDMVDMEGIDLLEVQGVPVEGLYNKLVESITLCRYQCLYNWKFNDILIPPTYVEMEVGDNEEVIINDGVTVTSDDVVHIYSIEPEPPEPVIIPLFAEENMVYNVPSGVDGFDPVTVDVPSYSPVIDELTVTQNGVYTAPTGIDGYSPINVNVPSITNWVDQLATNWDFSNPVNTRGQSSYGSANLIYTIDGWQLQGGNLSFTSDGIKLSRYSSSTAGFFMQRFHQTMTAALIGRTLTLSAIVDGELGSSTAVVSSGAGSTGHGMVINGVAIRGYNYGTEIALTIDIGTDTGSHTIEAIKLEAGSSQTLATLINGVWVLNNTMSADTEYIKARDGTIYNS